MQRKWKRSLTLITFDKVAAFITCATTNLTRHLGRYCHGRGMSMCVCLFAHNWNTTDSKLM